MTRKLTTILLALVLCLTLVPVGASAAPSGYALTSSSNAPLCGGRNVTDANEPIGPLNDETGTPETRDCYILDGGTYYLSEDVTIDKSLLIKGDTTLDLNGHVLKLHSSIYGGEADGSVIVVNGGVDFTLTDSDPTAPHKLKRQDVTIRHTSGGNLEEDSSFTAENGIYVVDDTNGTIPITGGIITGGLLHYNTSGGKYGGGVWVRGDFDGSTNLNETTFTMQGGNIVGCAADNGGGVYAARATFTMEGGCIKGCAAESFGGVGSIDGNFTMTGGTIEDCTANLGGAVGFNDGSSISSFTMQGGTISGCKTVKSDSGDVHLSSVQITANGGKVCGTVYIIGGGSGISTGSSSSTTAFYGEVTNIGYTAGTTNATGTISGGVFYGEVVNAGGTITGGVFHGTVTNSSTPTSTGGTSINGTISGGVFYGGITGSNLPTTGKTATFNLNYSGSTPMTAKVIGNTRLAAPVDPTREGYTFAGWYKESTCTNEATFPCPFNDDDTFYAKWTQNSQHRPSRVNTPIESPKTADIGVALYAVMTLTSCTGSALVVRGRKRK